MKLSIYCVYVLFPIMTYSQPKKIKDELKRASKYSEYKRMDTYHVLEKYLNNDQRFELNMFYWREHVKIPKETAKNYWLLNSARDNNICAQLNLAYSYKIGRVVKKDPLKARFWLLKSISLKSWQGFYYYGLNCLDNTFADRISDSTIQYFLKADSFGVNDATLALAYCFHYGLKTNKNDSLARKYEMRYNDFMKSLTKNEHADYFSTDNSIFWPNGYNNIEPLENQLVTYIQRLKTDSNLIVIINTNGNSNYVTQQISWDKAAAIKNIMLEKGIDSSRICFAYGGGGNNSIINIKITPRDNEYKYYHPPPPTPNFERTIIISCE